MELRILSGLHRGAVMELDDEVTALVIGASPGGDVDVMLADPGIAGRHCQLRIQSGHWQIEPAEGLILDHEGRPVSGSIAIGRGRTFRLAHVWIGFFEPDDPWDAAPCAKQASSQVGAGAYPRIKASVAMAVFAAIALPTTWVVSTAWGSVDGVARAGQPVLATREEGLQVLSPAAESTSSPAKLAEEFTRALGERELKDRLELQLEPDLWQISGSLEPEERLRLERLLVRFIETRSPDFPIEVKLVSPAELLPFKVVELVTGKTAFIVTDSGERLQIGDVHQGWRLVALDAGKATFDGKQRVEIAL